jgi:hypothetical protein
MAKLLLGKYTDIHSDPVLGAYYYKILKNQVEVFYIKDKKVVQYNTLPNNNNDIIISKTIMKPRVYPYNRNSLIVCFGQKNYIYYSSNYVDQLSTQRVWNNGILDTLTLEDCIIPEDFDLYKTAIKKSDLSLLKLDDYYTSYQYTEQGSNSCYRIQAILMDLINKKNYNINNCYIYDNFIVYDKGVTLEIYPYELQYNWNNQSSPIIIEKVASRVLYSNPDCFTYNGLIYDLTSSERLVYDSNNIYVFRGNFI